MSDPSSPESRDRHADGPASFPPELRERLAKRDPEALRTFFDTYFDRVYGYLRRLVHDEHLAEDLAQDVFLHVHRALPTYDPMRDLRPWVFTIATNKLRDHWRSRGHRESQSETSIDQEGALEMRSPGPPPEAMLSEDELGEQLRAAVDGLPEGMRMTVLLRAYEGLSFEAIGEMLERSEVAVRKRYSRALEALRAALGPAWQIHQEGMR